MLTLWILVLVGFGAFYYAFTGGKVTRHLGFLHFFFYFFAIYWGAYRLYVAGGSVNDRFMFSVLAYPVLAAAGMVLAQGFGRRTTFQPTLLRVDRRELWLVAGTVAFFLVIYAVYLRSLGSQIPLVQLLAGGEAKEARLARYLATKGYSAEAAGGFRVVYWLPRVLIDYFASFVVVFTYCWAKSRPRGGVVRFWIIFAGLVVVCLLDVQKHPALKLFVVLLLCHFNFTHVRLRLRTFVTAAWTLSASVLFAGVVYGIVSGTIRSASVGSFANGVQNVGELGWDLLSTRGVVGQTQPLYVTYDIIPREYDYFGGRTLTNPHGILPYESVALPYLIFDHYNVTEPGIQGSDPTVFFGEVYANWGLAVAFASMIVFGFVMQVLHDRLAANIEVYGTAFDVAFFYMVLVYLADFALSFSTLWFDERVWFFVLLYFARKRIAGLLAKPTRSPALSLAR